MNTAVAPKPTHRWSVFTARGAALVYISRHPGSTKAELAEALSVGERAAAYILAELTAIGAVRGSNGSGRRLHYTVNPNAPVDTEGGPKTLRSLLAGFE